MRIKNYTEFRDDELRAIAKRVADDELEPSQRNGVIVYFTMRQARSENAKRARRDGFYRRAVGKVAPGLRHNVAIVSIHRWTGEHNPSSAAMYAAHDLAHEMAEMTGASHAAMRSPRYMYRKGWSELYQWASDLPLVVKEKAIKIKPTSEDRIAKKLAHAQTMLKRAQRKQKLATTLAKKWSAKVRYFERAAARRFAQLDDQTNQDPQADEHQDRDEPREIV